MKRNRQGSVGILLVVLTDILFSHSNAFSLVLATDKPSLAREYRALPDTVVDKYLIKGNVTIRSVDWCQKNMPLQVYRGSRLQTSRRRRTPPHETSAPTSSTTTACANKRLLQSSQFLVDNIDELNDEKRRQLQMKMAAEARASQPLEPDEHLHILYCDEHICVTSKPSGVLSVPGPRRNPSLAGLVHETLAPGIPIDQMVVHRLDMDTSGIIVYALTELALKRLHSDFRDRRVKKSYQALLCGHLPVASSEFEIDVALERDPFHPPFMRVAQQRGEIDEQSTVHPSFQKFINQAPKPSLTEVVVRSREYLLGRDGSKLPVTRVEMVPFTGRTHQLRVHAAAVGSSILGDDIYGYLGEGDCGVDHTTRNDPKRNDLNRQLHDLGMPLCLHAERLTFFHPLTGAPMSFQCEAPF